MNKLSKVLRACRKDVGLTQAQLAIRIGVSRETVNALENSKVAAQRALTLTTLKAWYDVTGSAGASDKPLTALREYVMSRFTV